MAAIVVDEGELYAMDALRAALNAGTWLFALFANDIEIELDTVLADFTQPTFPGYAEQSADEWVGAITDVDGFGRIEHTVRIWVKTAGDPTTDTVYGWFLYESNLNIVLCAERLPVPKLMDTVGDNVVIHPVLTGQSKNEPA